MAETRTLNRQTVNESQQKGLQGAQLVDQLNNASPEEQQLIIQQIVSSLPEDKRAQVQQALQGRQQTGGGVPNPGLQNTLQGVANINLQAAGIPGTRQVRGQSGGLNDFIQKELVKQQLKPQSPFTQDNIPPGFEITSFRENGTPVVSKIKEDKVPTASTRRAARKERTR